MLTRRQILAGTGATMLLPAASRTCLPLGYSLKGFPKTPLPESLAICSKFGYDGVELFTAAKQDHDPAALDSRARREIRALLGKTKLRLHSFMEDLRLTVDDAAHQANCEHLAASMVLARDLQMDNPPAVETIVGGKPPQWNEIRESMLTRLRDWARVAEQHRVPVAIKAHVGSALHTPEGAAWMLEKISSEWVRLNFDYSHFQLQGFKLDDCVKTAIRYAAMVHVKDSRPDGNSWRFVLPGAGSIDYTEYARLLVACGYKGPVVVEVSTHVLQETDFDAQKSAQFCVERLRGPLNSAC